MWSSLPSNLRNVLGIALVLGVGVAVAAFALSFFALRDAASNPELRFGQGHSWLFPIGVDMALLFFEVLLIAASMVRVEDVRGRVTQYNRTIPFILVMVAAAGTLYFNATRVPSQVRAIALAVPVASILVTFGLAYLLKMLAAVSGADVAHIAPPQMDPGRITRRQDTVHGELVREDAPPARLPSGPHAERGALPRSPTRVQAAANYGSKKNYGALRRAGNEYLAAHPNATWRELQAATGMSSRYAKQMTNGG